MGVSYCTHLTAVETEAQGLTCLESIQAARDQSGIGIQTSADSRVYVLNH